MNKAALQEWLKLTERNKRNIFGETARKMKLPDAAIEKDWWVVQTLTLVFATEIGAHTVFKGGTSLSKAWNLINRFSEDIDLALDRKFLGFNKPMTNSQVAKLRRHSFSYITEYFFPLLQKAFDDARLHVRLQLGEVKSTDEDPMKIEVNYTSVTEKSTYLSPRVVLEIGCRSLKEPFTQKQFCSFVGENFSDRNFADGNISIPTVNPERTFLEKIFLLHEEFQQAADKIKVERRSRHLYDLEKLMDTTHADIAISNTVLYKDIVTHREKFNHLRGLNYANHIPGNIRIIPPETVMAAWEKDYNTMIENMIYGQSVKFDALLKRMAELQQRINKIAY